MSDRAQRIVLAPRAENGVSLWVMWLSAAFLALFIHVPMLLLITKYSDFNIFLIWFAGIEGARLALFYLLSIRQRSPYFMLTLRDITLSPRLLLPAAMVSFAFSEPPVLVYVVIIALWVGLELWAKRAADKITTNAAFGVLKRNKALVQEDLGTWLYRLDSGYSNLLDKTSTSGTFMGRSLKVGMPLVLIGPVLFLVSQRAGQNFEFRTFLVGCICLFIGYFLMPTLIHSRISRRTLRALERGELG